MTHHERPEPDERVPSPGRRRSLGLTAGLTAATLAAGSVVYSPGSVAGLVRAPAGPGRRRKTPEMARHGRVPCGPHEAGVQHQMRGTFPEPRNNGDEDTYPSGMVSFSKALPHNALGEVDAHAYRQLLRAMGMGDPSAFASVPAVGAARPN